MFDWWGMGIFWLLGLPPLALLVFWLASRGTSLLAFSSVTLFDRTPRTWRQRLALLPALLFALAAAALVVALARPRTPIAESKVTRDGIAIMAVVDLSSSMDARDMVREDQSVNRLNVAKSVFMSFVTGSDRTAGRGRPDDLIGVVTFARYADSICPLTLDHGNLIAMVNGLEIVSQRHEDGTAMGDGLGLAVERLRRSKAKSRVAVLLTDGVTNAGVIDPTRAAELARQHDIKVYGIGAGTRGLAPTPYVDFFGRRGLMPQPVEIDEDTLKQIADTTGGKYFRAVDKDALLAIYREIDALERTEVTEVRYLDYKEYYPHFVLAGLSLIGGALILNSTVFRRLP